MTLDLFLFQLNMEATLAEADAPQDAEPVKKKSKKPLVIGIVLALALIVTLGRPTSLKLSTPLENTCAVTLPSRREPSRSDTLVAVSTPLASAPSASSFTPSAQSAGVPPSQRVLLPVATVDNFDALPIPFRAVATDLESGEGVVLGAGDLAQPVRASMAVPGVFPPV